MPDFCVVVTSPYRKSGFLSDEQRQRVAETLRFDAMEYAFRHGGNSFSIKLVEQLEQVDVVRSLIKSVWRYELTKHNHQPDVIRS